MEQLVHAENAHRALPQIPQSVIVASLGKNVRDKTPTPGLPPEYISINKNARFFTVEMLAILGQGYKVSGDSAKGIGLLKRDKVMTTYNKRDTKSLIKGVMLTENVYGKYEDVNDVEKKLVQKLSPKDKAYTACNVLLILDDVVGDIKSYENNPSQTQLFFNRRHLLANGCLSIIVVSQKYTLIPSRIRSQASELVLFRLNPNDFEAVYRDVIMMKQAQWERLLQHIFGKDITGNSKSPNDVVEDTLAINKRDKKYDSLTIFVEYDMFFKNFEPINKISIN